MSVKTWVWIGAVGMLLGILPLYFALVANESKYDEGDYLSHFFVPLTAFTLYLALALGAAQMTTDVGRVYHFGRYTAWSITMPLLLYSLVVSGLEGTGVTRKGLVVRPLGADVYMILTAFLAGLSDSPNVKWSSYLCSCMAFLAIYGLLFGPSRKLAAAGPHGSDYNKKAAVLSIFHPVVRLPDHFPGGAGRSPYLERGLRCGVFHHPQPARQDCIWTLGSRVCEEVGYQLRRLQPERRPYGDSKRDDGRTGAGLQGARGLGGRGGCPPVSRRRLQQMFRDHADASMAVHP